MYAPQPLALDTAVDERRGKPLRFSTCALLCCAACAAGRHQTLVRSRASASVTHAGRLGGRAARCSARGCTGARRCTAVRGAPQRIALRLQLMQQQQAASRVWGREAGREHAARARELPAGVSAKAWLRSLAAKGRRACCRSSRAAHRVRRPRRAQGQGLREPRRALVLCLASHPLPLSLASIAYHAAVVSACSMQDAAAAPSASACAWLCECALQERRRARLDVQLAAQGAHPCARAGISGTATSWAASAAAASLSARLLGQASRRASARRSTSSLAAAGPEVSRAEECTAARRTAPAAGWLPPVVP
jgi:hypothetical protein